MTDIAGRNEAILEATRAIYRPDTMLVQSDGITIALPMSTQAANLCCRDTVWPHTGEQDMNPDINSGPLCVVLIGERPVTRLQLRVDSTGQPLFTNGAGDDVSAGYVAHNWAELGPFVTWASRQPGYGRHVLSLLPMHARDHDTCLRAVAMDGLAIQFVPHDVLSPQICLAALASNGWAIRYVAPAMLTQQMADIAVQTTPGALRHISMAHSTPALYAAALRADPDVVDMIPPRYRVQAMQAAQGGEHIPGLATLQPDQAPAWSAASAVRELQRLMPHKTAMPMAHPGYPGR